MQAGCCVLAGLLLAGCSSASLYFHNDAYEKATADAKSSVAALDVAGAFTALSSDAKDLATKEDQASVAALVALRNRALVSLIDPVPGAWLDSNDLTNGLGFQHNKAAAHLAYLAESDRKMIVAQGSLATPPDYYSGERIIEAHEKAIENANAFVDIWRLRINAILATAGIDQPAVANCAVAAKVLQHPGDYPKVTSEMRAWFGDLKSSCDNVDAEVTARDSFIRRFIGTQGGAQGVIGLAAAGYLDALDQQAKAGKAAELAKAQGAALLAKINDPKLDPATVAAELQAFITSLEQADALAQLAGLGDLDQFLQCGLLADLRAAKTQLPENKAVTAQAPATTPKAAACTTAGMAQTALTADQNKALATVIKVVVGAIADGLAADRLKRIDVNIVALAQLSQQLSLARITVTYNDNKRLLYRGQLAALLQQYSYLSRALNAVHELPDTAVEGFAYYRAQKDPQQLKTAAEALSAYVRAWNDGRIPAVVTDFRFVQAQRKFDLDVATATAANYKALVQPIADALAAYGGGGITPDTVAEILSNIGLLTGVILK
jgi:hypothetical protein